MDANKIEELRQIQRDIREVRDCLSPVNSEGLGFLTRNIEELDVVINKLTSFMNRES